MLARYSIVNELKRGATGAVYAARDRETGAVVALKRFDPAVTSSADAKLVERLLKQVRSARALKHRNLVEIYEAGESGGTVYVAMEMLEGKSLRSILDEGPLPLARAIRIVHDIANGLAHAHLQGVVHGRLKPSNVIVSRSGVAKITGFGVGQLSGISPEQLRGDPLDHRCDVFALGAVFYEMLTRRPPFEGDSPEAILESMLRAKPPLPSELNAHVPRALDTLVSSMLAVQPAARVPGVPVLLPDLQRLEEGLGLGSSASVERPRASAPVADPGPSVRTPPDPERRQHRYRPPPDGEAFDYQRAIALMDRESRRERSSAWRPAMFAAFALLAAAGIGAAAFVHYLSAPNAWRSAASRVQGELARVQDELATVLGASRATAPAPVAVAAEEPLHASAAPPIAAEQPRTEPLPPQPLAAEPAPSAKIESAVAPVAEETETALASAATAQEPSPAHEAAPAPEPAPEPEPAVQPAPTAPAQRRAEPPANAAQQRPAATARLILAISPRGEIYIDGKHHGTTPPITTFDLEPGMHRIEVRSGSRTPYLTYMTVQAGEVRRIRHDFDTSRSVRPPRSALSQSSNRPAR